MVANFSFHYASLLRWTFNAYFLRSISLMEKDKEGSSEGMCAHVFSETTTLMENIRECVALSSRVDINTVVKI